jgi:hypothetical protein
LIVLQQIVGWIFIIVGTISGVAWETPLLVMFSLFGGFILLSVSTLINILREINHKLLGIPLTDNQVSTIINFSRSYIIESNTITIYPDNETSYALIKLDGNLYIRARVFLRHLEQVEYEYKFSFPDKEPVILNCSDKYYEGVDLFALENYVFVRIEKLNLKVTIYKNIIKFE